MTDVGHGTTWTPGPWMRDGISVTTYAPAGQPSKSITTVYPDTSISASRSMEQMRANATLMASAPEMYATLKAIVDGDVPRPIAKRWRADGKPSKSDECAHGKTMHEDCGNCIDAFAEPVLARARGESND